MLSDLLLARFHFSLIMYIYHVINFLLCVSFLS